MQKKDEKVTQDILNFTKSFDKITTKTHFANTFSHNSKENVNEYLQIPERKWSRTRTNIATAKGSVTLYCILKARPYNSAVRYVVPLMPVVAEVISVIPMLHILCENTNLLCHLCNAERIPARRPIHWRLEKFGGNKKVIVRRSLYGTQIVFIRKLGENASVNIADVL